MATVDPGLVLAALVYSLVAMAGFNSCGGGPGGTLAMVSAVRSIGYGATLASKKGYRIWIQCRMYFLHKLISIKS